MPFTELPSVTLPVPANVDSVESHTYTIRRELTETLMYSDKAKEKLWNTLDNPQAHYALKMTVYSYPAYNQRDTNRSRTYTQLFHTNFVDNIPELWNNTMNAVMTYTPSVSGSIVIKVVVTPVMYTQL